jgi:hypothetical protein
MTTTTYGRRVGRTGRPLGLADVLGKIVETGLSRYTAWAAARRAGRTEDKARAAAAREAALVRRMADRYAHNAPGFAADLYAAADQHELRLDR